MSIKYEIDNIDFSSEKDVMESLSLLKKVFNNDIFTSQWWRWKYLSSPFGEAIGWCAKDINTNSIISVRIVWKWKFISENKIIDAYQMVDSATDESFRGIGLFTTLTRQALSYIDGGMIFNFPNKNSSSLDKKIGWNELSNQPWLFCVSTVYDKHIYKTGLLDVDSLNTYYIEKKSDNIHTLWSKDFFKWRFVHHPYFVYYYFQCLNSFIIYKIEKYNFCKIATILYVTNSSVDVYNQFSGYLLKCGIVGFRYNAYCDRDYETLKGLKRCIEISRSFKYFVRNLNSSAITITAGDTDFL